MKKTQTLRRVVLNGRFTYETDLPLKKGDKVVYPSPWWARELYGPTQIGEVTRLTSDYKGECIKILSKA